MSKLIRMDWTQVAADDLKVVRTVVKFMSAACFNLYPFDEHFGITKTDLEHCVHFCLSPDDDWIAVACMHMIHLGEGYSKVTFSAFGS